MNNKRKFGRRGFLKRALATGVGAAAFGGVDALRSLSHAAGLPGVNDPNRRFVFCYFSGGWDILLGLDPKDPNQFSNGNKQQTRIEPAYEVLGFDTDPRITANTGVTFGPYIGSLANHADKLAVVRGMSMDTLTHEAGRRRFLTGKPPSGLMARGSSGSTLFASALGKNEPIPNLAIRTETYNEDQPQFATGLSVTGVSDLQRALRQEEPQMGPALEAQIQLLLDNHAACPSGQHSSLVQSAQVGRAKASEMVAGGYESLFDFAANTEPMAAIRDHFGFNTSANSLVSPAARAALAATAITSGLSRAVSVTIAEGLDTHYDNWITNQGPNQQTGFEATARLIEYLENTEFGDTGESYLDHTTIVGFSEFSRTPLLNKDTGRDHSLTNACFLAGAGIQGGAVAGASSDIGMEPQRMDLVSGGVTVAGEVVRPEHILRALLYDIGIESDAADLRVDPLRAVLKNA